VLTSAWNYAGGSEMLSRHSEKLELLPMGLDLAPYAEPEQPVVREAERIRRDLGSPLWLAVGRCVYYKGLHTAIEALRHVPGRLLIVGEGPLRESLMRLAARLGVQARVSWWNQVDEAHLRATYRAAEALWFASNARSEAFGLVQVEAMASGCPVINTEIPHSGVSWVSRHEETGLTVPMDDPRALAAAARRLLDEPGLRDRLVHGGCVRVAKEFNDQTMARRSIEIYQRVLSRRKEAPVPAAAQLSAWVRQMSQPAGTA
jgi:rhamnosyl/mannosyltransferase